VELTPDEAPPSLNRFLFKCLEKRPAERYKDAGDMKGAFESSLKAASDEAEADEETSRYTNSETNGVDQVCAWLHKVELGEYVSIFQENKIDGALLQDLTEDELATDFGMTNKYHRRRLLGKRSMCAVSEMPAEPLTTISTSEPKVLVQLCPYSSSASFSCHAKILQHPVPSSG
jgi:hypothetical protein